jgi:hypothetical protein
MIKNQFQYYLLVVSVFIIFIITLQTITMLPVLFIFLLICYNVYYSTIDSSQDEYNGTIPDTYTAGNQYMSAKEKREYLKSSKWKTLQDLMYILHDSKCECCGNPESLEVHHNTYERLGSEDLSDLNLVCRDCHQHIHGRLGYDRTTQYPIK